MDAQLNASERGCFELGHSTRRSFHLILSRITDTVEKEGSKLEGRHICGVGKSDPPLVKGQQLSYQARLRSLESTGAGSSSSRSDYDTKTANTSFRSAHVFSLTKAPTQCARSAPHELFFVPAKRGEAKVVTSQSNTKTTHCLSFLPRVVHNKPQLAAVCPS